MRAGAFPAAVAAALLFATTAFGQTAGLPDGPTDMQFGRLLFEAGRFRDARAFLQQARPIDEEERIERLFLLGLAEMRLGFLPEAAERFEAILALRPELTRVRLELARVYGLLGRDGKARFHFEASLGDELPSSVEDAVEVWLDRIDARKRWSVSVSAAILPESNPAKRTDDDEVRIGGVPFRLNDDAREASGTGLLLSTGAQYSPALADDWRGVLAASGAAKLHEQSGWNDISVQGDVGVARLFDRGSVSGGLRLGHASLQRTEYEGRGFRHNTIDREPREDETQSLSVHNRAFTVAGFSPRISLIREERDTNAQALDYESNRAELSFVRQF